MPGTLFSVDESNLKEQRRKGSFLFITFPKRGPRYFSLGHKVLNPSSGTGASLIEHAVFMFTGVAVKCPLDGLDCPLTSGIPEDPEISTTSSS